MGFGEDSRGGRYIVELKFQVSSLFFFALLDRLASPTLFRFLYASRRVVQFLFSEMWLYCILFGSKMGLCFISYI